MIAGVTELNRHAIRLELLQSLLNQIDTGLADVSGAQQVKRSTLALDGPDIGMQFFLFQQLLRQPPGQSRRRQIAPAQHDPGAFLGLYFLEGACPRPVCAFRGGGNVPGPNPGVQGKSADQGMFHKKHGIGNLAWPALLRTLDRIDPSFRD